MSAMKHNDQATNIRIHLVADSIIELFQEGLEAMNEILLPGECGKDLSFDTSRVISVEAPNLSSLLVKSLNQILHYSIKEGVVYCEVNVRQLAWTSFIGTVFGRKIGAFEPNLSAVAMNKSEVRLMPSSQLEAILGFE